MSRPLRSKRPKGWKARGPTIKRDTKYVYFISAHVGAERFIKIGFTIGDVFRRCKVLQLGSPVPLEVVAYFTGIEQDELNLHHRFKHLHSHREWFICDDELHQLVESIGLPEVVVA